MPLTPQERLRCKYHLGYPAELSAASISYGIARPQQTLFLVELALNNLQVDAEDKVRQIVSVLDGIECRLIDAQERLAAKSIEQLTMRPDEPDALEREYYRWGGRLADILGVPFYAYSNRYKPGGQVVQNISVRG